MEIHVYVEIYTCQSCLHHWNPYNEDMSNEAFNPFGALEELQETNEFQEWIGDLQRADRNLYRKIESEKLKPTIQGNRQSG